MKNKEIKLLKEKNLELLKELKTCYESLKKADEGRDYANSIYFSNLIADIEPVIEENKKKLILLRKEYKKNWYKVEVDGIWMDMETIKWSGGGFICYGEIVDESNLHTVSIKIIHIDDSKAKNEDKKNPPLRMGEVYVLFRNDIEFI